MNDKPKVGLVGVGHLGRIHLAKLQKIETVDFAGFYDIDREKSARVSHETGAFPAESLDQLLEKSDIVSVVVPTHDHYDVGMKVTEAGCHLFMEKPMAEFGWQAREILDLANQKQLKIGVGHIERFNPAVQAMKDKIGKPVFIEAHRLNPFNPRGLDVAVILELMIHDIDLCLMFTNSQVDEIHVSAVQVLSNQMDIANARLSFKSGCVANLTASRISPAGMRKIRIFQRNNYLSFDLKQKQVDSFSLVDDRFDTSSLEGASTSFEYWETGKKIVHNRPQSSDYDMLETELRAFLDAVITDVEPPVTGQDGYRALYVAREIEKKAWKSLERMNLVP